MSGCDVVALGTVARFVGGGTPSKSQPTYWNGDIPWVSPKDMWVDEVDTAEDKITPEAVRASATTMIPANSVLCVVRSGILARKFPVALTVREVAINQDIKAIIPGKKLDARYLFYFLKASEKDVLAGVTTGATVHRVDVGILRDLRIPIPDMQEQRRIVAILDEALGAIASSISGAEKNLVNARDLFVSALREELENAAGAWTTLGHATDIKVGFAFKSAGYSSEPDDVRLIRGDNVVQGQLRWDDVKRWPRTDLRDYDAYQLEQGDILIAMDRTWVKAGLKYAVLTANDVPSLLVQRVARLRPKAGTTSEFVGLQIAAPAFTEYVLGIQTGLGVPHISGQQIADYRFRSPTLAQQSEITTKLGRVQSVSMKLTEFYDGKLKALSTLKQSLLQRAFSGELIGREPIAA